MNIQKIIAASTTALLLTACATGPSTIPITDTTALTSGTSHVIVITETTGPMMVVEPSKAAFGALGGIAAASKGAKLAEKHSIVSPNVKIEAALKEAVAQKYNMQISSEIVDYTGEKKPKAFLEKPGYIAVDSGVNAWGYNYYPTSWGKFRVLLNVTMQIVDGNKGELIAGHHCAHWSHDDPSTSPTHSELFDNNAERLKLELDKLADICIAEFNSEILNPTPAVDSVASNISQSGADL